MKRVLGVLGVVVALALNAHAQTTAVASPIVITAGDTTYRGQFSVHPTTGVVNGAGVVEWRNGNRYEGPVRNTKLTGMGTFRWASGDRYEGELVDARPNGQGSYFYTNGDRYVGGWREGRKHGQGRYTFADGSVTEGVYANDQLLMRETPPTVVPKVLSESDVSVLSATPAMAAVVTTSADVSKVPNALAVEEPVASAAPTSTVTTAASKVAAQAIADDAPWVGKNWEVRRASDNAWRTPAWVFNADGSAEAAGLWKGTWEKLSNGRVQLKFITRDGKLIALEAEFAPSGTEMTMRVDGKDYGVGRVTASNAVSTATAPIANTSSQKVSTESVIPKAGKMVGCYQDNGDGTLTDSVSGLVWSACLLGQRWDGSVCRGGAQMLRRGDAFFAAWRNRLAGKDDWMIPTRGQWNNTFLASCKQWTDSNEYWVSGGQRRASYWTKGEMTEVALPVQKGFRDKDSEALASVRLLRNGDASDKGLFQKDLNTSMDYRRFNEANSSWISVQAAPTQTAITEFLKKYPNAPQSIDARALLGQMVFSPVRQEHTMAAYARFIREWPDVPEVDLAREQLWLLGNALYASAKKSRNFDALAKFIQAAPQAPQLEEAQQLARGLLEPTLTSAKDAGRCEEARGVQQRLEGAGLKTYFDYDYCVSERSFKQTLASKNPQVMYLAAVKLENENYRSRAKTVYLAVMERFPENPVAMKAADRLAALKDVESVEDAQSATRREISDAQSKQGQRAYDACRIEVESCQDKVRFGGSISHCYRDCNKLLH